MYNDLAEQSDFMEVLLMVLRRCHQKDRIRKLF